MNAFMLQFIKICAECDNKDIFLVTALVFFGFAIWRLFKMRRVEVTITGFEGHSLK